MRPRGSFGSLVPPPQRDLRAKVPRRETFLVRLTRPSPASDRRATYNFGDLISLSRSSRRGRSVPSSLFRQAFGRAYPADHSETYSYFGLRTLDILHVASALLLQAERFWTFDQRQSELAKRRDEDNLRPSCRPRLISVAQLVRPIMQRSGKPPRARLIDRVAPKLACRLFFGGQHRDANSSGVGRYQQRPATVRILPSN